MRLGLPLVLLVVTLSAAAAPDVPVDSPQPVPIGRQELPRVAAGSDGYLTVWRDYRANGDTYAARFDRRGTLLDPLGIRIAPGQAALGVIAVADGYLIAIANVCGTPVEAVFVSSEGVVSPPTQISEASNVCAGNIDLATNGETVLAVWNGRGALLDTRGKIIRAPIALGQPFTYRITVASNGSDYLVASYTPLGITTNVSLLPLSRRGDIGPGQLIGPYENVTGVAIASAGNDYLVALTGAKVNLQRVNASGVIDGTPQQIDHGTDRSYSPRLAWNGTTFGVAYSTLSGSPPEHLNVARVRPDGTPIPPAATGPEIGYSQQSSNFDIAPSADGFFVIWRGRQTLEATIASAAAFSQGALPGGFFVTEAAPPQLVAKLVAVNGRFIALWVEQSTSFTLRARVFSIGGIPVSAATDVAAITPTYLNAYAAAYDGTYVTIGWGDGTAHIRRFTPDLAPVDAQPIVIANPAAGLSIAGAGGVTLAAWQDGRGAIVAAVLDTTVQRPSIRYVSVPRQPFNDHDPVVAWNGSDFAVMWASALGPQPLQGLFPDPPDDILGVRITSAGALVDSSPVRIAHLEYGVSSLDVASNGTNRLVVWTPNGYQRPVPAVVFGQLIGTDLSPVRAAVTVSATNAAGPIAVAPHADGYVVAWRAGEPDPYKMSVKLRLVDANGNPGPSARLEPDETTTGSNRVGVASAKGKIFVEHDRIAYGAPEGGVSRVFLQEVKPEAARRRAVSPR